MKEEVGLLIKEMQDACRRSLFRGIDLSISSATRPQPTVSTEEKDLNCNNTNNSNNNSKIRHVKDNSSSSFPPDVATSSAGYPESESGSMSSSFPPGIPPSKRLRRDTSIQQQQQQHQSQGPKTWDIVSFASSFYCCFRLYRHLVILPVCSYVQSLTFSFVSRTT